MVSKNSWLLRWKENRIGFHESGVNRYLETYVSDFQLRRGARIFMPLCGKANDIAWLAQQGFEIIGVELSPLAISAFFNEHGLRYQTFESDRFRMHKAVNISILEGDFFDLCQQDIGDVELVYDRAALIALEPAHRKAYCAKILSLIPDNCRMLVVLLEYFQVQMQGPPFSVSVDEVMQHYGGVFLPTCLQKNDVLDERPRWKAQGLTGLTETVIRFDRQVD